MHGKMQKKVYKLVIVTLVEKGLKECMHMVSESATNTLKYSGAW